MKKLMAPAVSQVEAELMNVWDESAPTKVVVPLAPELRTPRKTALLSVLKKPDQLNYRGRLSELFTKVVTCNMIHSCLCPKTQIAVS